MKKVLAFLKDFWFIHFSVLLLAFGGSYTAFDTGDGILLQILGAFLIFVCGALEGVTIGICICLD